MAEPNQDQPIEPTEPERYQTETDDVSESSTSSGGDVQVAPQVHVEPPLTKTQPPIFYIPIPSPGDPVPLIPTKAFVVRQPKSVFLSDFAVQSTSTGEPTEPNQVTQKASGSGQVLTDSDVDISTVPVRSPNDDVDIPVLRQPPTIGKQVPTSMRPQRIAKSSFDVDSKTPVPALGRVIWSSTDVVIPKSVFMPNIAGVHMYPPVAFGEFTNAVPGTAPKSQGGWSGSAQIPMPIPPPITGWRAPGIPHPPPLPAAPAGPPFGTPTPTPGPALVGPPIGSYPPVPSAVHLGPSMETPTRIPGQESNEGSPFQTPSSIQFTSPRVIPGPRPLNIQPEMQPRVLFQTSTIQPNQTLHETDERQGVRPFLSTSASSSQDVSGSAVQTELNTMLSSIQTLPTAVPVVSEPNQEPINPEPEDEPQVPPIRVPAAWDKSEGIIILVGGFSNAGKSSLVEAVCSAFGLKRWKDHPNKKVWISNETGQEKNSRRQLLHYTNDSFRMSNNEINHTGLNQSIDTMCAKFSHWVVFVEGHRILDNEDLVNRSSLFIWIHTPSKTRKLRSPYSKGKSTEEWNTQLREEQEYFNHHKNLFSKVPFTILDGLQTKAYNAMVVMGLMGCFSKDLDPKSQLCYHEFEMPKPEDELEHPKHDPKQFSTIFTSKIVRPSA